MRCDGQWRIHCRLRGVEIPRRSVSKSLLKAFSNAKMRRRLYSHKENMTNPLVIYVPAVDTMNDRY